MLQSMTSMAAGAHLYMTERSMAKTGCTVELLEVPRNMADTKMAPITFSTSPCDVLKAHRTILRIEIVTKALGPQPHYT
jgi:hypothetical protein